MHGILCMTVLAAAVFKVAGNVLAEDWELAKDEDDMKVYLSSVRGSKYKAYRGVIDIKADVAAIGALQEDIKGSHKWIHVYAEIRLLKQESVDAWTYLKIDAPWPVTGRDMVIHVTTEEIADGTAIHHLKTDPTYIPEKGSQICVPKLVGEWRSQPKGQGVMEVTYQVKTEPGSSIPSWLANNFVVDAPPNILKDLRNAAKKC